MRWWQGHRKSYRRSLIKAVLVDVGGTLIRPEPSVGAIYAEVAGRHGMSIAPDVVERRFRSAWKERPKTAMNRSWWEGIVQKTLSQDNFPAWDRFFSELYDRFRDPAVWHVFEDVRPALTALRNQGLRLAIASNWDDRLPSLLDALGLAAFFETSFISFSLGFPKSDPRFAREAL